MIADLLTELRRRLAVTPGQVPDEALSHFLEVADGLLLPWLADPAVSPDPHQDLVDEAVVQLAVKLYDVSARGVAGPGIDGDWTYPAPSATPGLVRSVFGVLGPALATGGLSV